MADPNDANSPASDEVSTAAPAACWSPAGALAALDAWFAEHVPDSAISRDTTAYNRVFHAVAEIKAAISTLKE